MIYVEKRLHNNGQVETLEVDEDRANGWLDNPGYSSDGFYFVIDTSDRIEKRFNRFLREEKRDAKERYLKAKKYYESVCKAVDESKI